MLQVRVVAQVSDLLGTQSHARGDLLRSEASEHLIMPLFLHLFVSHLLNNLALFRSNILVVRWLVASGTLLSVVVELRDKHLLLLGRAFHWLGLVLLSSRQLVVEVCLRTPTAGAVPVKHLVQILLLILNLLGQCRLHELIDLDVCLLDALAQDLFNLVLLLNHGLLLWWSCFFRAVSLRRWRLECRQIACLLLGGGLLGDLEVSNHLLRSKLRLSLLRLDLRNVRLDRERNHTPSYLHSFGHFRLKIDGRFGKDEGAKL